jgi:hypothetical protein
MGVPRIENDLASVFEVVRAGLSQIQLPVILGLEEKAFESLEGK